jgi:hypothetical protein
MSIARGQSASPIAVAGLSTLRKRRQKMSGRAGPVAEMEGWDK